MKEQPEWKEYVRKDKHKEFIHCCRMSALDSYSIECIMVTHICLAYLQWGYWLRGMGKHKQLSAEECWDETMKHEWCQGLSDSQAGFIAGHIIDFSPRGKEFEKWWDKK